MSAKAYAHAQAREGRGAIALHRTLGRSMRIAGATAMVTVRSLTSALEPRFETTWSPATPARFSVAEIRLFLAFRLQAMAELRAEIRADGQGLCQTAPQRAGAAAVLSHPAHLSPAKP